MSSQEVFVEQFERLFHHYEEALCAASDEEPDSRPQSWKSLPVDDHNRMVAAARLAILELETNARTDDYRRKYFAKPGEAEWGC